MILQDMRRHLFRTLYYLYDLYEAKGAVNEKFGVDVKEDNKSSYWAAPDYTVQNGVFTLIDPRAVAGDYQGLVGMWTISHLGNDTNSGNVICRIGERDGYSRKLVRYDNASASRPGAYLRSERTTDPRYPTNGVSGNVWSKLAGLSESRETEWFWDYTEPGVFVPHTEGVYRITCIGGGGGGGGGGKGDSHSVGGRSGGGGGGSGYQGVETTVDLLLTKGETYEIKIGKAGTGGEAQKDGTEGSASSFGSLVVSPGGGGGRRGGNARTSTPGSGGSGGNSGTAGGEGRNGVGGETDVVDSRYGAYYRIGSGGRGGNGTEDHTGTPTGGVNGLPGLVIVEFRSL